MTSASNSKSKQTSLYNPASLPSYLQEILAEGAEVYEVGGPVRDRLLGQTSKDRDILVRKLSFKRLQTVLRQHGKVHLVGKSFGVLKFRPNDDPETEYDIALPRKEISTGTGHRDFEVEFDPELNVTDDLQRRDFTINAMALNYSTGELCDPYHGQADMKNKVLRQVHENSFIEDPLRLMRAVQFAARLHLKIEEKTWQAMREHASLIQSVSPERISMEVEKLLRASKPSYGFCIMRDTGLLEYIFPELAETVGVEQGKKLKNDDVFLHTMRVLDAAREDIAIPNAGQLELMLAALFHDVGKPATKRYDRKKQRLTFFGHQSLSTKLARKRIKELKMSTLGVNADNIATLIDNHMFQAKSFFTDKAIRRFIRSVGENLVLTLVDLRIADNRGGKYPDGIRGVQKLRKRIEQELAKKPAITISDLAIGGHELMQVGVPEGPQIGQILANLLEVVLDDPCKNEKETLLHIVCDTLGFGKKDKPDVDTRPAKKST